MTADRRIHSTLYKKYSSKPKLEDDFPHGETSITLESLPPLHANRSPESELSNRRNLACESDAVGSGVVQDLATFPTAEDTYTFTDYTIRVYKIIRNSNAAPLQQGDSIIVTRPGGTVTLADGRVIAAVDDPERPLLTGGKYLFYLKYLPRANAYQPVEEDASLQPDTYEIKNGRLFLLDQRYDYDGSGIRIERQTPARAYRYGRLNPQNRNQRTTRQSQFLHATPPHRGTITRTLYLRRRKVCASPLFDTHQLTT